MQWPFETLFQTTKKKNKKSKQKLKRFKYGVRDQKINIDNTNMHFAQVTYEF